MAAARAATLKSSSPITVLIVDDEYQSLKYFSRWFGSDFEVLTCSSAQEAEDLFEARKGNISVIISDHRMPTTTGVALLAKIKDRWPDTIRLLTTAYADTESLAASINEAGVHRFVAKPWDLDELRETLDEASQSFVRNSMLGGADARRDLPPLVGIVAHELATPLLSIEMTSKSIIAAARQEVGKPHDSRTDQRLERFLRAAERIGEDAARARRLARSLADLARDTATSAAFKRVSMRSCIERAIETFPYQNRERERVYASLSDDFIFLGTGILMSAVITNVLSNALDAARAYEDAKVTIVTTSGPSSNSVFVRDTGGGVASEVEGKVFRPFVTGKKNGTGLGLAICDWIVKSFGGSMRLTSEAPNITVVEIRLPHPTPQVAAI